MALSEKEESLRAVADLINGTARPRTSVLIKPGMKLEESHFRCPQFHPRPIGRSGGRSGKFTIPRVQMKSVRIGCVPKVPASGALSPAFNRNATQLCILKSRKQPVAH